jgi:hypothetical protein
MEDYMATNAIALRQQSRLAAHDSHNEWETLVAQAKVLIQGGFLPTSIKTEAQALTVMMQGRELGIGPMAALGNINVIQGKPTVSPQLMIALINRSGELEDMKVTNDAAICTVVMKRRGRTPVSTSFSQADADALGLANKDNWRKQAKTMRQWRAIAACARVAFPDVILGLYTPDEMGAETDTDGALIPKQDNQPNGNATGFANPPLMPAPELSRKDRLVDRIEQLYQQESALGGETPAEECFMPLSEQTEEELIALGKLVSARVKKLEAARKHQAEGAPVEQPVIDAIAEPVEEHVEPSELSERDRLLSQLFDLQVTLKERNPKCDSLPKGVEKFTEDQLRSWIVRKQQALAEAKK